MSTCAGRVYFFGPGAEAPTCSGAFIKYHPGLGASVASIFCTGASAFLVWRQWARLFSVRARLLFAIIRRVYFRHGRVYFWRWARLFSAQTRPLFALVRARLLSARGFAVGAWWWWWSGGGHSCHSLCPRAHRDLKFSSRRARTRRLQTRLVYAKHM